MARCDYQIGQEAVDHCNQKRDARCTEDVGYLYDGDVRILAVSEEAPEEAAEEKAAETFCTDEQDGDSQE